MPELLAKHKEMSTQNNPINAANQRFYVGSGNNAAIVRSVTKYRYWWN